MDFITYALSKKNGNGGSSDSTRTIQPDYNQNDDMASNYIKNRPFYDNSKVLLEWDGNIDGLEHVTGDACELYRIADYSFTPDEVDGATITIVDTNGGKTEGAIYKNANCYVINDSLWTLDSYYQLYIASVDGCSDGTTIFPKAGVYFVDYGFGIDIKSYSLVKKNLKCIDEKFIPSTFVKTNSAALVGQLLRVQSVDEDGKPIMWETVDENVVIVNVTASESYHETDGLSITCSSSISSKQIGKLIADGKMLYAKCVFNSGAFNSLLKYVRIESSDNSNIYVFEEIKVENNSISIYQFRAKYGMNGSTYKFCYNIKPYNKVQSVNGYTENVVLSASDIGAIVAPKTSEVGQILKVKTVDENGKPTEFEAVDLPTKTSELTNDVGFITKTVSDLENYYTKTETEDTFAKKTDIPTVPTKVSAFENDKGYLTSIPSEYVTEDELTAKGYATQSSVDSIKSDLDEFKESGGVTDEQLQTHIETWLTEHPEATTTVQDGSITEAKLADNAVAPQKTSFLEYDGNGVNLFNKITTVDGYEIYQGTPYNQMNVNENACVSDYIPVEPNTLYCRSANSFESTGTTVAYQYTFFYDVDKNGLSCLRHYYDSKSFTTPENCAYIRINLPMDCKDVAMVVRGNTEPSEYVPYEEFYKLGDSVRIAVSNFKDLQSIFEAMPDGMVTKKKLSNEIVEELESVDARVNNAVRWNDVRKPSKTLTGRINVFKTGSKGIFDIGTDISDKTIVVHGVNYFNVNDLVWGTINNNTGVISGSTTDKYTEHLIPVQQGNPLYFNRAKDSGALSYLVFYFYDAQQKWISSILIGSVNLYGKKTIPENAYFMRVSCGNYVDGNAEKLCIADVDIGNTTYDGYDGSTSIDGTGDGETYFGKNVYFPYVGYRIENGILVGTSDTYTVEEITHVDIFEGDATIEVTVPVEPFDKDKLKNVSLKYGRYGDTNYVLARVYKTTVDGKTIKPSILCNTDGGIKLSDYSSDNDFVMAINAGIFFTDRNNLPIGTTIVDGEIKSDKDETNITHGLYDSLGIDDNGDLKSVDYSKTASEIITDGCNNCLMGWATIIDNYTKTDLDAIKEVLYPSSGEYGSDYIVTAKHPRTAIGQFRNGDYMVFVCDGRQTNQSGMTLSEMQDIFMEEGVRYAYNLDGGGSCNMMLYKKELAPYTEGRKDPTYIIFN